MAQSYAQCQQLGSLVPSSLSGASIPAVVCNPVNVAPMAKPMYYSTSGWGNFLLWFIIIAVIAFVILWLINPAGLQQRGFDGQPNGNRDAGKIIIASLVLSAIFIILLWLLRSIKC